MSGSQSPMLHEGSNLPKKFACLVFSALFIIAWTPRSSAQSTLPVAAQSTVSGGVAPPLDVPIGRLPAQDPNAIAVDGWLLYPTLRLYSLYSDNLFLSPVNPISAGGLGVTPSMVAVWSNGIHTTTLYGSLDRQVFPTDNAVNVLDGRTGFTQKYEAMRDLIFSVNGNYTHQTLTTGLQNSIQTPTVAPATTVLPNGNTVLPNGTILSPTGQPVGQTSSSSASSVPLLVNPSNQITGTFTVEKIFNRAVINLSGSVNRTEYENQNLQANFNSRTLTENAAAWIGPLLYAYTNGVATTIVTDATSSPVASTPSTSTTSYRVVGGLGTDPLALFRGSVYFGHQGSEGAGETAGGNVYGATLAYQPIFPLTFTGTVDRTINIASQQQLTSNLALTLPGLTAVQIPLGASTDITSLGLQSAYQITQQWFLSCQLAYSRIEYLDTPRLDNSWVFDVSLRYDIWRNMSLTWEYRYTSLLSTAPLSSATSNYGIVGATYRF